MRPILNSQTNNKGLTLLELVVTVALFAIMSLVITRLYLQVLSAQDRILDEQNIISDLNYATAIFLDDARRASVHMNFTCDSTPCTDGQYFCTVSNRACLTGRNLSQVDYYNNGGVMTADLALVNHYAITSTDVTVNSMTLQTSGSAGDQIEIKIKASGNNQYNQSIFYQNYITK